MTRKSIVLLVVAVLLAAVYTYYFTDWISPPTIQIIEQVRPLPRPSVRFGPPVNPVSFLLDGKYKLTSVKVVPVSALATNKSPLALWHLVQGTNPIPVKGFFYGLPVPGMRPYLTNARPQRIEPGVLYRLLVQAGRLRGQVDFKTTAAVPR
jgi:hypothetical protein